MRYRAEDLGFGVVIVATCVAAGRLSIATGGGSGYVACWLPIGVIFAALARWGPRQLPAAVLGSGLTSLDLGYAPLLAAGYTFANCAGASVGAVLLRRTPGFSFALDRTEHIVQLARVTVVIVALNAPLAMAFTAVGGAPSDTIVESLLMLCLSQATGILLFAPLVFVWSSAEPRGRPHDSWLQVLVASGLLVATASVAFGLVYPVTSGLYPLVFLPFPVVMAVVIRYGQRGASLATAGVVALATWSAAQDSGPFDAMSVVQSIKHLWVFTSVTIGSSLVLGAVVLERRAVDEELMRLNAALGRRIEHRTAELERSNQDLADFAHIVSHDLKAPLRAISSLATWLIEDHGEQLDAKGRERADLLRARAVRMDALIDGVLAYSRVGRAAVEHPMVDSAEAVRHAIRSVGAPPEISIHVDGALPRIAMNHTQLEELFQNLIGNAVKYMDAPEGEVRISCSNVDGGYEFHVTDTGPGIAERHFERVFGMFQTLQPRDRVEATGVGLAIVKKLVERRGGHVSVKSTLGEGSDFSFTIPRAVPSDE